MIKEATGVALATPEIVFMKPVTEEINEHSTASVIPNSIEMANEPITRKIETVTVTQNDPVSARFASAEIVCVKLG